MRVALSMEPSNCIFNLSLHCVSKYRHSFIGGQQLLRDFRSPRVAIIGAGIGGLASAVDLARRGVDVVLLERAATPGGKLRQVEIAHVRLDAGPTVFTLPRVFDELFADAGDDFRTRVKLTRANLLARHVWSDGDRLDLFADLEHSVAAIGAFAGEREARGYRRFIERARGIYEALDETFMFATRPSPLGLARRVGLNRLGALWNIRPFETLWQSTADFFQDARLRQLFSRYATYCGSSPFACPATLMLIAHVEQAGVWYVQGGMHQLAVELAALAQRLGCRIRYGSEIAQITTAGGRVNGIELRDGERLPAEAVVCNADSNALAQGLFGPQVQGAVRGTAPSARTLSAVTVNALAATSGTPLAHHTVFFSDDYRAEFDQIFGQRTLPHSPTLYVCAQDRCDTTSLSAGRPERLLCLMNAPPTGDSHHYLYRESQSCTTQILDSLQAFGLKIQAEPKLMRTTTPEDFEDLFPATGGALYGPASHGWRASFHRPGSRTSIPGLYLAGGSVHPGAGVPMAAISGRLAAAAALQDLDSI